MDLLANRRPAFNIYDIFSPQGWASLRTMRYLTMPWLEYGSRQTATPPYAGTRSMMAVMVVSAYSTAEGVRLKKLESLQMQINSNVLDHYDL